jgi:membrane protease YdiL (CAAX protease family)
MPSRATDLLPFAAFLAGLSSLWIIWCILLIRYPDPLDAGFIRALARLLLWIVPTLVYVRVVERQPLLEYLGLQRHVGRGLFWGSVAVLLPVAAAYYRISTGAVRFQLPLDEATWLNPVLGAPIAEELLFRGLVFQKLEKALGTLGGALLSAVLFASIHFPYWFLSGAKSGGDLAFAEAEMFAQGVAFAVLFRLTRSLWAPLVYHFGNNLVSVSLRPLLSE